MATLSEPNGVGTIVAEVPITAAADNRLIPAARKTGYNVASKMIARFEALGMTLLSQVLITIQQICEQRDQHRLPILFQFDLV